MNTITPRDWIDEKAHPEGWTPLVCQQCHLPFHGWKMKVKCFVCAIPVFPRMRHISHVAVRFAGKTYSLPAPNRHHHILRLIHAEHGKTWPNVQGFLDNRGKFLRRKHSVRIALAASQVLDQTSLHPMRLFSEDLW